MRLNITTSKLDLEVKEYDTMDGIFIQAVTVNLETEQCNMIDLKLSPEEAIKLANDLREAVNSKRQREWDEFKAKFGAEIHDGYNRLDSDSSDV